MVAYAKRPIRFELLIDLLKIYQKPMRVYRASLQSSIVSQRGKLMWERLMAKGFLQNDEIQGKYRLSEKGRRLLKNMLLMQELVNNLVPDHVARNQYAFTVEEQVSR